MAKEYIWKLQTESGEKEVTCVPDGSKYHIYIGDAFVTSVFKNMSGNADVELTLGGVPCRFVSFAEKPDLVVDGRLLSNGKSYETVKSDARKNAATVAAIEIMIGLIALVYAIFAYVIKGNFAAAIPVLVIPLAFIIFGAWELYNLNNKK